MIYLYHQSPKNKYAVMLCLTLCVSASQIYELIKISELKRRMKSNPRFIIYDAY